MFKLLSALTLAALLFAMVPKAKAVGAFASGTLLETATGASFNTYAITLTDTGASSLSTFWFAWVPGADFLDSSPSSISTPTGWTDSVHNNGGGDGYSIEFTTSTTPLASGSSLAGFGFESPDSVAQMAADSVFHSGTAATTSEVSTSANDGGVSSQPFVVAVVPEPGIGGCVAGALCVAIPVWRLRRRR